MKRAKDILPEITDIKAVKPPTPIQERLLAPMASAEEVTDILYQHSILCQTCMPYRNPGDDTRVWRRRNGIVSMSLAAGQALDPGTGDFVDVGLPWGSKARLVLYHLNAEALKQQSRIIEVEDSLTAFVRRTLKLDAGGRTIRTVKEQLARLSAADFRFGATYGQGRAVTVKGTVIEAFELWAPSHEHQRVLWPSVVRFAPRYFDSLLAHAVPLNEEAVSRLTHSAMALDVYTWLAQRLHRVDQAKPAFVPWVSLKEQFGQGYDLMFNFRRVFGHTLAQVAAIYRDARFSIDGKGMYLKNSRPPVLRRYVAVEKPME